jgi:hypothetical protein
VSRRLIEPHLGGAYTCPIFERARSESFVDARETELAKPPKRAPHGTLFDFLPKLRSCPPAAKKMRRAFWDSQKFYAIQLKF